MRISLLAVLLFAGIQVYGQRLENIRAQTVDNGEKVIITYDINGGQSGQKFKISVYGSHNNYATSLTQVTGDVNDVTPGTNKKIEWNAKSEMTEFNGDITFELRADPIISVITLKTPSGATKGKTTDITWTGGTPGENIKLELVRSSVVVQSIGSTMNTNGRFTWAVPADAEKGSDYQVRLTAPSGVVNSGQFGIKSKINKWLIIGPAAAVVVGVVVFAVAGGGPDTPPDLPTPPTDPN